MPRNSTYLAVLLAATRSAAAVHNDLKRGLNSLVAIAPLAPLLGLLITVDGIVGSFIGCSGEKSACLAAVVDRLANAITRGASGLLVGIVALWCYRSLRDRLEELDSEMRIMALGLANALAPPSRIHR